MSKKTFILDTSVSVFDGDAIFAFEEHDVVIPVQTLTEFDGLKNGNQDKNYEVRKTIRHIDNLTGGKTPEEINNGVSLGEELGKMLFLSHVDTCATDTLQEKSIDNHVLDVALHLMRRYEHSDMEVIVVSKDISLRNKARALGIIAEDYKKGNVDEDSLESNVKYYEQKDIKHIFEKIMSKDYPSGISFNDIPEEMRIPNGYFIVSVNKKEEYIFYYHPVERMLKNITNYSFSRASINPINFEQKCVMHALSMSHISLIALTGVAGTGKTLLALADAVDATAGNIIAAKPPKAVDGEDYGFVPGDLSEKMAGWMESYIDNIKVIRKSAPKGSQLWKKLDVESVDFPIEFKDIGRLRGRSINNTTFIVDEMQNVSPTGAKTIITRAGRNSKFILAGDLDQIDDKYLGKYSNGLSHTISGMRGLDLFAHIHLVHCERSELSKAAGERL